MQRMRPAPGASRSSNSTCTPKIATACLFSATDDDLQELLKVRWFPALLAPSNCTLRLKRPGKFRVAGKPMPAKQLRKKRLRLPLLTKSDRSRHNDRWNVTRESSEEACPARLSRALDCDQELRSSKIVSNQYCLSCSSEQRTFIPSAATTVIIDPPGSLLKTSSPRLNVSIVAIVVTPSMRGTLRSAQRPLLDGTKKMRAPEEILFGPILLSHTKISLR
jgi:hypothetical protein